MCTPKGVHIFYERIPGPWGPFSVGEGFPCCLYLPLRRGGIYPSLSPEGQTASLCMGSLTVKGGINACPTLLYIPQTSGGGSGFQKLEKTLNFLPFSTYPALLAVGLSAAPACQGLVHLLSQGPKVLGG